MCLIIVVIYSDKSTVMTHTNPMEKLNKGTVPADDVVPMAVTELVPALWTLAEGEAPVLPVEFDVLEEENSTSTRSMSKSLLDSCIINLNASDGAKGYSAMEATETEIDV